MCCRTYETSLLVDESISDELPYSGEWNLSKFSSNSSLYQFNTKLSVQTVPISSNLKEPYVILNL